MARPRISRCFGFLAVPIVSLLMLLMNAAPTLAWCNPTLAGQGRYNNGMRDFDGWTNTVQSSCGVGGTYANFSLYDPYVTNPDSSVWTMVNNGSNYAQVGYLAQPGSPGPENGFTEYYAGIFTLDHWDFPMPTLWSAEFKVLYNNTPGQFSFFSNGSVVHYDNAGFTPNEGEQLSEITTWSNQMYGEAANHERIWNSHIYVCGWGGFSGTGTTSGWPQHWTYQVVSAQEIQVWDLCK